MTTYTRHIDKAMGAILLPYWRIGGHLTFPPPFIARVQTDGSMTRLHGARIAALMRTADGKSTHNDLEKIKALSSTEAEWASVAFGLELALKHDQQAIGIENDCLGVIHALMYPTTPLKHSYARYFRAVIIEATAETDWVGVRWIPREMNRADALLR